jgi:hypothetical protein
MLSVPRLRLLGKEYLNKILVHTAYAKHSLGLDKMLG